MTMNRISFRKYFLLFLYHAWNIECVEAMMEINTDLFHSSMFPLSACSVYRNDFSENYVTNSYAEFDKKNVSSYIESESDRILETTPRNSEFSLNLKKEMSVEEALYLLNLNVVYNFSSAQNRFPVQEAILWKRRIVDLVSKIFKRTCHHHYVPHGYINIIKELFLFYQNHLHLSSLKEDTNSDPEHIVKLWRPYITKLEKCANELGPLVLGGNYNKIVRLLKLSNDRQIDIALKPLIEDVDIQQRLQRKDDIIDGMWWIFSFTYGTCYNYINDSGKAFLHLFDKYFLEDLKTRWLYAGVTSATFGTIFGEYDDTLVKRNIRYCVSATYIQQSIPNLQLVRPLNYSFINTVIQNIK